MKYVWYGDVDEVCVESSCAYESDTKFDSGKLAGDLVNNSVLHFLDILFSAVKNLKSLCYREAFGVAKFAARAVLKFGGESCEELSSLVKSSMLSLSSRDSSLPSVLCCLTEVARRCPSLLSDNEKGKIQQVSLPPS